ALFVSGGWDLGRGARQAAFDPAARNETGTVAGPGSLAPAESAAGPGADRAAAARDAMASAGEAGSAGSEALAGALGPPAPSRRRRQGADAGSDAGDAPAKSSGPEGGDREADGGAVLRGAALTQALEKALAEGLDDGKLGPLQGLLISELTLDGTRFSGEDLPLLFDALLAVDDFGLQKLVLTHLERIEGLAPEDLAAGYLDYLESSRRPHHSEEIFQKLARIGGEDALEGISDIFRGTESPALRRQALSALAEMGDARSVPVIQEMMRREQDPQRSGPYLDALARIGGRDAVGTIVDAAVRDSHPAALRALREITDRESAPIVSRALSVRAPLEYQREALRTLGRLADPGTAADLGRYLDAAEGRMAQEAISALGRFQDPGAARVLEQYAARQEDARLAQLASRNAQRIYETIERARQGTRGARP
ncbi:MAG: HEAT repeat domain-containing protein, partial [Planctomycetes bacterium]|nr:HEAT repeat domain-containing protein [Planctomycetota bacterium]